MVGFSLYAVHHAPIPVVVCNKKVNRFLLVWTSSAFTSSHHQLLREKNQGCPQHLPRKTLRRHSDGWLSSFPYLSGWTQALSIFNTAECIPDLILSVTTQCSWPQVRVGESSDHKMESFAQCSLCRDLSSVHYSFHFLLTSKQDLESSTRGSNCSRTRSGYSTFFWLKTVTIVSYPSITACSDLNWTSKWSNSPPGGDQLSSALLSTQVSRTKDWRIIENMLGPMTFSVPVKELV